MLCFTSPTISAVPWLMHSSISILKFFHCVSDVSWNSSIIMWLMYEPVFSYMNVASPSVSICDSRSCVSLSSDMLFSSVMPFIFSLITFSSLNDDRCFSVRSTEFIVSVLSVSFSKSSSIFCSSRALSIIVLLLLYAAFSSSSVFSRHLKYVVFFMSLKFSSFRNFSNIPSTFFPSATFSSSLIIFLYLSP